MIEQIFANVEENFYLCLNSDNQDEVKLAVEKLKSSLTEADFHSEHAKTYSKLFIEMFQFKVTSCDSVWAKAPRLHDAIGDFIHLKTAYEDEFREEVSKMGLGKYLDMYL